MISKWIFPGVVKDLPPIQSFPEISNADFYKWLIENKYYTALIHFCKILDKNALITQSELRNKIEVVIIYFNSQQVNLIIFLLNNENYIFSIPYLYPLFIFMITEFGSGRWLDSISEHNWSRSKDSSMWFMLIDWRGKFKTH